MRSGDGPEFGACGVNVAVAGDALDVLDDRVGGGFDADDAELLVVGVGRDPPAQAFAAIPGRRVERPRCVAVASQSDELFSSLELDVAVPDRQVRRNPAGGLAR